MPSFPSLSRPGLLFVAGFALASVLVAAKPGWASYTHFVQRYCNSAGPVAFASYTRAQAMSYALRARWEGYQWGGGCWNDNNVDDSPGDPPGDPNTGGEGGDCSGFTFKVWRESPYTWDDSGYEWDKKTVVHGPFDAAAFKAGSGAANWALSKYK